MTITNIAVSPQNFRTLQPTPFRYSRPKANGNPKHDQARTSVDGLKSDDRAGVPVVLTVPEACAVLKISKWTLYQLIRSRQLETIKIGARRCVPATAIQTLIDRLRSEEAA